MLRPGTASLTVAEEEGSDQMQVVQPGTQQQQQQQQQARQHCGPYGLLDEQDENDSSMNDSAALALAQQQESQHQQQQARQRSGHRGLPHDQGGSSTVMEASAAHQQVSSCFQHIINAGSKTGHYIEYNVYVNVSQSCVCFCFTNAFGVAICRLVSWCSSLQVCSFKRQHPPLEALTISSQPASSSGT